MREYLQMFEKGAVVYGYEIMEPIGSGGLSRNYKARSPDGSIVTLKFPSLDLVGDPATYERFQREFKICDELVDLHTSPTRGISDLRTGIIAAIEHSGE